MDKKIFGSCSTFPPSECCYAPNSSVNNHLPEEQQSDDQSKFQQYTMQPQFQQYTMQPQFQQYNVKPQLQQYIMQPQFQQYNMLPESQYNIESQLQQINMQPHLQQINMQPQLQQFNMQPQLQQINMQPQLQQFNMQPQLQQYNMQPQLQQYNMQPQLQQYNMQPQLQQYNMQSQFQEVHNNQHHESSPNSFCSSSNCVGSNGCGVDTDERLTVKLQADQPIIPVPLYQDILRRDKYVEVPKVELHDTFVPLVYTQDAIHDVPKMDVSYRDKPIELSAHRYVDKPVEVPVNMGYKPCFAPKWDVREVPRPIPKYYGEQQVIEIEVPRIEYIDKPIEKELVIDVQEKIVPKIVEVEKEVQVVQYEWKKKHQDIPVYKYVPKFDVELECPPPLIVPYPETMYVKEPPIYSTIPNWNYLKGEDQIYQPNLSQQVCPQNIKNISPTENFAPSKFPGVTPAPSPQLVQTSDFPNACKAVAEHMQIEKEKKKKEKKKWWFWPFCKEEPSDCCKSEKTNTAISPYPTEMPSDFAYYFQKGVEDVREQKKKMYNDVKQDGEEKAMDATPRSFKGDIPPFCDLEPTVEYKGAVNKPPKYGGKLEPISFKLHAIEVHQYIPLPNVEIPQFVKLMPSCSQTLTAEKEQLEKLFGPVSTGWADPKITGMPAPMMNDILQGNLNPNTPLFQEMASSGQVKEKEIGKKSDVEVLNNQMLSKATAEKESNDAELYQLGFDVE